MTTFLSRLAVRSVGAAPLLRPRIPTLFEPASFPAAMPEARTSGRVADHDAAPHEIMRNEAVPAAGEPGGQTARRQRPDTETGPTVRSANAAPLGAHRGPVLSPRRETRGEIALDAGAISPGAVPPMPILPPLRQTLNRIESATEPTAQAANAPVPARRIVPRAPAEAPVLPISSEQAGSTTRNSPRQTQRPDTERARTLPEINGAAKRVEAAPTAAAVSQREQPASAARSEIRPNVDGLRERIQSAAAQAVKPAAQEARPPAIHVNIGRIEVRNAPASAKPTAQSVPRPRGQSLDEYLKTRGSGR